MDQETRIKYFPPTDMACGLYLEKVEEFYKNKDNLKIENLDDALEFYNIYIYFHDSKIHWKRWNNQEVEKYKQFSEELKNLAFQYIAKLNSDNFTEQICNLFFEYFDDLATLLEQTKVYRNIDKGIIQTEFYNKKFNLFWAIIKNKHLSKYYSQEIYNYFESCVESAELIIDSVNRNDVFIPEIVKKNQEYFMERYINLPEPNLNRLITIQEAEFKPSISPKTKLLAKRKAEELNEKYLNENHLFTTEYNLVFVKGQKEKVKYEISKNRKVKITYSQDWIDQHSDYYTLLKNFADMIGYLDNLGRINDIYKPIEDGFTEKLNDSNKGTYKTNNAFKIKNDMSILATNAYDSILYKKNISFEKIINWFITEHLTNDYSLPKFRFSLPSEKSTYAEKCQTLVTSLDSLIKQYKYYVTEKELDFELITMDTQSVEIENLPSLLNKKYVYGKGIEYQNLVYLLFSDQSDIAHNQKIKKHYKSFAELITNEKLQRNDFLNFQLNPLNWLFEIGIICADEQGYLNFTDEVTIGILFNLFKDGFIPYWNITDYDREKITELDAKGYVKYSSGFLSEQEADYFNYYLNKKFTNGLEIRNKYAHGMAQISESEDEQYKDYLIILKLVFIFLLKMDNEVNIYDKI